MEQTTLMNRPTDRQILLLQRLDDLHARAGLQDSIGKADAANRLRSEAADVVDELIETGLDPMDL